MRVRRRPGDGGRAVAKRHEGTCEKAMAKNSPVMTPGTPPQRSPRPRQPLTADAVRRWWRETRSELRKVTWPTTEQTRNLTLVVLAVCVIMAIFLGIVDSILGFLVKLVIG